MAVTADYISEKAREEFFSAMDAANIDLKAFTERFYRQLCSAELGPVLDTLEFVKRETNVWLEITTPLIPGCNDSSSEVAALSEWVVSRLGPDVPLHFSAFPIRDRPTAPRSPWQNGHTERLIGSIRRECLDHVVVLGERHLRGVLRSVHGVLQWTMALGHISL